MPQCAVVNFNPPGGEYFTVRDMGLQGISPTQGCMIAWTDDGSNPVPNGNGHQTRNGAFRYLIHGHYPDVVTVTLKAIAYMVGFEDSEMVEETYVIHFTPIVPPPRPLNAPSLSPPSGNNLTFPFTVHITLYAPTGGDIIIYTLNDGDPTPTNGIQDGTGVDVVLNADTVIRAVGYRAATNEISHVVIGSYVGGGVPPTLDPPIFEPTSGGFEFPLVVNVRTVNPQDPAAGIVIYTINDQVNPSWTHGTHAGSSVNINLAQASTIRAIAAVDATHVSPVVSGVYTEEGEPGGGGFFGGVTVVVGDQDTIFGGVIIAPGVGDLGELPEGGLEVPQTDPPELPPAPSPD